MNIFCKQSKANIKSNQKSNMDLLSIFPKDELNFINIHVGIVIKDEEHLEECVEEYLNNKKITFFETTNIKNMNSLFEEKNNFNILLLWNVSNVRDMGGMFSGMF